MANRYVGILLEHERGTGDRFVDLCVSLRVCDVEARQVLELDASGIERWRPAAAGEVVADPARERWVRVEDGEAVDGDKRWKPGGDEELIRLGGCWDTSKKRWAGAAKTGRIIRVHRGQEAAARWLAQWFRGKLTGRWGTFRKVYSALFNGGRRSGKSHLAVVALLLYAVAFPGATTWGISPTQEETDELVEALRSMVPVEWYRWRGAGAGKVSSATLHNGARIMFLSGHKARTLKRGRADLVLYNEAQNQTEKGFVQLCGAVADRGGLVIGACNPPDEPIGRWVERLYNKAVAHEADTAVFDFRPSANPWIHFPALKSIGKIVDEKTYAREVEGQFTPIGDVVFFAWTDHNWVDPGADLIDVTAKVTRERLGRAFGYVVGMDFQKSPHMAARVFKFFVDPADPEQVVMPWLVDEVTPEDADEDDLLDALEARGRWTPQGRLDDDGYRGWTEDADSPASPVHCAVVMDASAWWQDGEHSKGKSSDKKLRARRWTFLYRPQVDEKNVEKKRNPDVVERVKLGNGMLKAHAGRRRFFVARHCSTSADELRRYENRNGIPYSRSPFSHGCDAATYVLFRFWGLPKAPKKRAPTYDRVRTSTRVDDLGS